MNLNSVNQAATSSSGAGKQPGAASAGFLNALKGEAGKYSQSDDTHEHGTYGGDTGGEDDRGGFHDADDPDSKVLPEDVSDLDAEQADESEVAAGDEAADAETEDGEDANAEESVDEGSQTAANVLEVELDDGEGGRRKMQVDLTDHAKLKRYIQMAAGVNKAALRNKQAIEAKDAEIAKYKPDAELGQLLVSAWKDNGIDGIIRTLTGDKQSWDSLYAERAKLEAWKQQASPADLAAYNAQQEAEKARREADEARKLLKDQEESTKKAQVDAERSSLQAAMDAGQEKFGFSGKLGDAAREHRLNTQVFLAVQHIISQLPDETVLSQGVINRLWKEQVDALQLTVKQEAQAETKKIVQQKSREAKTQAQAAMRAATPRQSNDVGKQVQAGGLKRALRSALIRARG